MQSIAPKTKFSVEGRGTWGKMPGRKSDINGISFKILNNFGLWISAVRLLFFYHNSSDTFR
jgi:hypothetical protein